VIDSQFGGGAAGCFICEIQLVLVPRGTFVHGLLADPGLLVVFVPSKRRTLVGHQVTTDTNGLSMQPLPVSELLQSIY
jgi:hypothetical protein